jgi:hypothetical protein
MPTFSSSTIAASSRGLGHVRSSRDVRDSDGRLWSCGYDNTLRHVKAWFSDDDGATWTEEAVWDTGVTTGYALQLALDQDEEPIICVSVYAGNMRFAKRTGVASWTVNVGSLSSGTASRWQLSNQEWRWVFLSHSNGKFYRCSPTTGSSIGTAEITFHESSNLTDWVEIDTRTVGATGGGATIFGPGQNGEFSGITYNDEMHMAVACRSAVATSTHAVRHVVVDPSDITGTFDQSDVIIPGGTGDTHNWLFFTHNKDLTKFALGVRQNVSGSATTRVYHNADGSWVGDTPAELVGIVTGTIFGCLPGFHEDDTVYFVVGTSGFGTNSSVRNIRYYERDSGGTWTATQVTDTANAQDIGAVFHRYPSGAAATGIFFVLLENTANSIKFYESDDAAWFEEGEDPEKFQTVAQTILAGHEVALPFGSGATVSPTMRRIGYGGRQSTRIAGRIYTLAVDKTAGRTHSFYSDDGGDTWTQELVVNFAAESASITQGAGNQPLVALVNPGTNRIRFYLRVSSGGWEHKSNVGTGSVGTCYSHQCLYDGTNYHLLYARIHSSTGRRQVRHAVSTDLSGWSSSNVDNGGTSGQGAHVQKALAACIDREGDIHLAYTQVQAGDFHLRYVKYSSGSWGTVEDIENLGGFSVDTRKAIQLCIVTDRNEVPHLFGVKYYSGTHKVFYRSRAGGTWSAEENPIPDNVAQVFPSAGFNDRQFPTFVVASNLPDGTVHLLEKKAGAWGRTVLSAESGTQLAEQVYDPRFNSAISQQGTFTVYQESILVFVTHLMVWGDDASGSGDVTFTQLISLQGFGRVASELVMGQSLQDPSFAYSFSVGHTQPFSQVLSAVKDLDRPHEHNALLGQGIGLHFVNSAGADTIWADVQHTLILETQTGKTRTSDKSITHSLVMSQVGPGLERRQFVEHEIELLDDFGLIALRQVTMSSSVSLDQVVHLNKDVNVGATHTLTVGQGLVRLRAWVWNSTHFDPGWPAEYEGDVGDFIILGPDEAPTISMTLPRPDFGDEEVLTWRAESVRRNRTGQARVFRAPIYSGNRFTWSGFLRKRAAEFREIVKALVGRNVRVRDHNGVWKHVVITGTTVTSAQSGPEFVNVDLQVEERSSVA